MLEPQPLSVARQEHCPGPAACPLSPHVRPSFSPPPGDLQLVSRMERGRKSLWGGQMVGRSKNLHDGRQRLKLTLRRAQWWAL